MTAATLDALDALESEAIHIFREVAGELERPVILFSGGKDSTLLVHLAAKAFAPAPVPFPLLHVDTGHNYPEVIRFRDDLVAKLGLRLHDDILAMGELSRVLCHGDAHGQNNFVTTDAEGQRPPGAVRLADG